MRMELLNGYEGKKLTIYVNGHAVEAVVSIRYEFEPEFPKAGDDFDFGNAKENSDYARRFETGELSNVYIQVSVHAEGLEGMDSLGACHVVSRRFVKDVRDIVRTHGMIREAREHLTKQILDAAARFPKYLKAA